MFIWDEYPEFFRRAAPRIRWEGRARTGYQSVVLALATLLSDEDISVARRARDSDARPLGESRLHAVCRGESPDLA
jgi:hypothetical protein